MSAQQIEALVQRDELNILIGDNKQERSRKPKRSQRPAGSLHLIVIAWVLHAVAFILSALIIFIDRGGEIGAVLYQLSVNDIILFLAMWLVQSVLVVIALLGFFISPIVVGLYNVWLMIQFAINHDNVLYFGNFTDLSFILSFLFPIIGIVATVTAYLYSRGRPPIPVRELKRIEPVRTNVLDQRTGMASQGRGPSVAAAPRVEKRRSESVFGEIIERIKDKFADNKSPKRKRLRNEAQHTESQPHQAYDHTSEQASVQRDSYAGQDPYANRDSYAESNSYTQSDPYAQNDQYANPAPQAQRDPYANTDSYAQRDPLAPMLAPEVPNLPHNQRNASKPMRCNNLATRCMTIDCELCDSFDPIDVLCGNVGKTMQCRTMGLSCKMCSEFEKM